jgi:hypothetical protein
MNKELWINGELKGKIFEVKKNKKRIIRLHGSTPRTEWIYLARSDAKSFPMFSGPLDSEIREDDIVTKISIENCLPYKGGSKVYFTY